MLQEKKNLNALTNFSLLAIFFITPVTANILLPERKKVNIQIRFRSFEAVRRHSIANAIPAAASPYSCAHPALRRL